MPDPAQFTKCEICGASLGDIDYDTPLYCTKCMEEMEKRTLSPEQFKKERKK